MTTEVALVTYSAGGFELLLKIGVSFIEKKFSDAGIAKGKYWDKHFMYVLASKTRNTK